MNQKLAFFATMVIVSGLIGNASAHKSQVVGGYEIEVGWQNEPPMIGKENAITVMITPAPQEHEDETHDEAEHEDETHDEAEHEDETHDGGISGLANILEVTVTLNDQKTTLELTEDEEVAGLYVGAYTPTETGHPTVHVFVTIDDEDVEATFHPEEIEEHQMMSPIQQQIEGITPNEVECAEGKMLMSKVSDGTAICVKQHTAELLLARGWAIYF